MTPVRLMLAAMAALILGLAAPATAQVAAGIKRIQVANNTTAVSVCTGSCTLMGVNVFNNSATIAYLKLYATPAASVTCGTTTVTDQILIPASTSGAGAVVPIPGNQLNGGGVYYPNGLAACITTGYADSDTTAPAASTYIVTLFTR